MSEKILLRAQKNEITEHYIYGKLADGCTNKKNKKILKKISNDELHHYHYIKSVTKKDVSPKRFRIFWYVLLSKIFGLSFGLKLMERGEELAQEVYKSVHTPSIKKLWTEEQGHEKEIIRMLEDERIEYAGAIVLGLNDALVELSGALAGFSLALQNTQMIALIGFITGFAASLSMAASGFLSSREESSEKNPLKGALYTGAAYIVVVLLLIAPYLFFSNHWTALIVMLSLTIMIIAGYTYYISVAKELKFWKRFGEMAAISLGVALLTFMVGFGVRTFFGVDI